MQVRKRTTSYNEKKDYHTSIQKFGVKPFHIFCTVAKNHIFQHENVKRESQGHSSAFSYGEPFSAKLKLISWTPKKVVVL